LCARVWQVCFFGALLWPFFQAFVLLALGMALLGMGLGLCMPAITAGASLAVSAEEQGGAAGVISLPGGGLRERPGDRRPALSRSAPRHRRCSPPQCFAARSPATHDVDR
jgi:hypothetical protein